MQESLQGMRMVKAFNLEDEMRRRLDKSVAGVQHESNKMARVSNRASPIMEMLGGFTIALATIYGGYRVIETGATPGQFVSFMAAFLLAYEPAKRLARLNIDLNNNLVGVRIIYEVIDSPAGEPNDDNLPPLALTAARVEFDDVSSRWLLKRPADHSKDQTYFLFGLTQEQLSRTLFPLGHMTKPEVRELARQHGLALAEKPDSQEICFVPGGDYKQFIDAYLADSGETLPDTAGELVTTGGVVIGEHHGIHNFTVGQRKGLGVATGSPLYVIQINGADKQVIVGGEENLYSRTLRTRRVNLIAVDDLIEPMRVSVKIRHRHESAAATIQKTGDDEILVTFDQPQRAITPGQAAVFYDNDVVVGGGWIV